MTKGLTMANQDHTLIVLGTINRDHTVFVERPPQPGETVLGHDFGTRIGGKGANQAVAAARAGVAPRLVSAVGDDSDGQTLMAELERRGVDVTAVAVFPGIGSGVALITVDAQGENSIVVAGDAGTSLDPEAAASAVTAHVTPGTVVLSQLELPLKVVEAALAAAQSAGARVVLNLSPAQDIPSALMEMADPLLLNAHEAATIAAQPVTNRAEAEAAAAHLVGRCRSVVITLGPDGVVHATAGEEPEFVASTRVEVIDTTGAGDAFAGALAATLAQDGSMADAVTSGVQAGAAAVQHVGAQPPE